MRSYGEYCALAKSLDVVGDRWTLLIVRELGLQGACRYTDLRNGLPGIATNLLAARLRELEHGGVVSREDAAPPIATTLFHLTPRGEELRPVLEELTRWGLPLMTEQRPQDAVRTHWLAWAIELMLTDHEPNEPPVTLEVRIGDPPIAIETRDGAIRTRLGAAQRPDLTLTGDPKPILGLLFGALEPADAVDAGVTYEGDLRTIDRIRGLTTPTNAIA